MGKYKKGSAWKRGHWDKWGFWRRVWHCISVFLSFVVSILLLAVFTYGALLAFGLQGFMLKLRDLMILQIMKDIFG
jgi:hypothetical protein